MISIDLTREGNRWRVAGTRSTTLPTDTALEDAQVAAAVRSQHDKVVAYVNTIIGTSKQAMSASRAPVEDVPLIDFVNYVQADTVKRGLTGSAVALPVLSIVAPFSRSRRSSPATSPAATWRALHLRQLPVRGEGHRRRSRTTSSGRSATSSRSQAPGPSRWIR